MQFKQMWWIFTSWKAHTLLCDCCNLCLWHSNMIAFHCGPASSRCSQTFSPMFPLLSPLLSLLVQRLLVRALSEFPPLRTKREITHDRDKTILHPEVEIHHGLQTLPCSMFTLSANLCVCIGWLGEQRYVATDHKRMHFYAKILLNSLFQDAV